MFDRGVGNLDWGVIELGLDNFDVADKNKVILILLLTILLGLLCAIRENSLPQLSRRSTLLKGRD